jgi:hypothetical protein
MGRVITMAFRILLYFKSSPPHPVKDQPSLSGLCQLHVSSPPTPTAHFRLGTHRARRDTTWTALLDDTAVSPWGPDWLFFPRLLFHSLFYLTIGLPACLLFYFSHQPSLPIYKHIVPLCLSLFPQFEDAEIGWHAHTIHIHGTQHLHLNRAAAATAAHLPTHNHNHTYPSQSSRWPPNTPCGAPVRSAVPGRSNAPTRPSARPAVGKAPTASTTLSPRGPRLALSARTAAAPRES